MANSSTASTPSIIDQSALNLLLTMQQLAALAESGHPSIQPYLDADAIRVIDGKANFHHERFINMLAEVMEREDA